MSQGQAENVELVAGLTDWQLEGIMQCLGWCLGVRCSALGLGTEPCTAAYLGGIVCFKCVGSNDVGHSLLVRWQQ